MSLLLLLLLYRFYVYRREENRVPLSVYIHKKKNIDGTSITQENVTYVCFFRGEAGPLHLLPPSTHTKRSRFNGSLRTPSAGIKEEFL